MQQRLTQSHTRPARVLAVGAVLALALAGCASNGAATPSATPSATAAAVTFPVDVATGPQDAGATVTIEEQPDAIVALSPTATETLFAIGAGDQVVAVDQQSNYPDDAPITDLSGYEPNVEAILGYSPDLVVAANATEDLIGALKTAGVPTLVLPSAVDLDDAYGQIARLGTATGHTAEAESLVTQMKADIASAVEAAPALEGTTYFHELDPTLYTVTGDTFIGQVYSLYGLESIADATGGDAYPQLSQEFVVEADPDLIFLADAQCCSVTAEQVAARSGWSGLTAVKQDQVVVLDADIASRWGPRVVDFVETIGEQVADLESAKG